MAEAPEPTDFGIDNPGRNDGDDTGIGDPSADSRSPSGRFGTQEAMEMMNRVTSTHREEGRQAETSFDGDDERIPLLTPEERTKAKSERMDEALRIIQSKFPRYNPAKSSFTFDLDYYGQVTVKLKRLGGRVHVLFDVNGNVGKNVPESITKSLGPSAEEVIGKNDEEISEISAVLRELGVRREEMLSEEERGRLDAQDEALRSEANRLEEENEGIREQMSLRDRVKAIFKKYGLTLVGVVAAVGTVLGVLLSNLKAGLAKVAKGTGDALKAIGKKIGEILPGMIGATASFIFKTVGEAIGFLAKHTWLLIVAVVIFFVEKLKGKK